LGDNYKKKAKEKRENLKEKERKRRDKVTAGKLNGI
jgi:hypothetical protein